MRIACVTIHPMKVGDTLMGPDSKPRTVLSVTSGVGPLYRVDQKIGDPYVCNDAHILSLQTTNVPCIGLAGGQTIHITAVDYCKKSFN
jgi:hypothetical protein